MDELESLTETVQNAEIEHQGKYVKVQWCELTESEEPKYNLDDDMSEEDKQQMYVDMGKDRCFRMVTKANERNPDFDGITPEVWEKVPSTLKYKLQNTMMGVDISDFPNG